MRLVRALPGCEVSSEVLLELASLTEFWEVCQRDAFLKLALTSSSYEIFAGRFGGLPGSTCPGTSACIFLERYLDVL